MVPTSLEAASTGLAVLSDEFSGLKLIEMPHKGLGVVATKTFKKGSFVLSFLGQQRRFSELTDLTHALQIDQDLFLAPSGKIDDFVNHSCNPNTGVKNDPLGGVILFALRNIHDGEEITFDYATTQSGGFSQMKCSCGEKNCRQVVGDFEELPVELKSAYLSLGAVLSYLANT